VRPRARASFFFKLTTWRWNNFGAGTHGSLDPFNPSNICAPPPTAHRKLFDGNQEHETRPFKGTRISFIAFTHGLYNKLHPWTKAELLGLGFTAARSDGKDLPFFERFRIEKSCVGKTHLASYLSGAHVASACFEVRTTYYQVVGTHSLCSVSYRVSHSSAPILQGT